jgi:hypothetical protein
MRIVIYAVDVGKIENIGWWRVADDGQTGGRDLDDLIGKVTSDLDDGGRVALGFEAPLFVPAPMTIDGIGKQRRGDAGRPWCFGAGTLALAFGVQQATYVLGRVADRVAKVPRVALNPSALLAGDADLVVWEAFVSEGAKDLTDPDPHLADARAAALEFERRLATGTVVSDVDEPAVLNLVAAALIAAGLTTDVSQLRRPCVVVKAPVLPNASSSSTVAPPSFGSPSGPSCEFDGSLALASWDAASHPAQIRLGQQHLRLDAFIGEHAVPLVAPLAVGITVGLQPHISVTGGGRDLDNFLEPVVRHVSTRAGGTNTVVSAHARKLNAPGSSVAIGPAVAQPWEPGALNAHLELGVSASQSRAWSEAVAAHLSPALLEPAGSPVRLMVGIQAGTGRNWVNLWKSTIDGLWPWLGGQLGAPHDDRLTSLALHCRIDAALRNHVVLDIAASPDV